MENMIALRCKYCGAPLDAKEVAGDSPYVTCPSCGTTQQRVDAQAYLDQLMGQVRSWINKAVPGGMVMAQSESVDSVARHSIFMNSVKPRVDVEFGEYKFALTSLLANPMLVMPFTVDTKIKAQHTPAQAFEFSEKMTGVSPLAVDVESKELVTSAKNISDAYALLINNTHLLREEKDGRYILMANNFNTAAEDFKGLKGYEPANLRFSGLSLACQGCEKLLNGDVASALLLFDQGKGKLAEAKTQLIGNMKVAIMGQPITTEIKQIEALEGTAKSVNSIGGDPLKALDNIRRIFSYQFPTGGNWGFMLNNKDRLTEIFSNMSEAVKAKEGGAINIASGDGDILVPFWHVDLKYSFQTGSLWKKKAVEVHEDALIPADFVIDEACLNNPRSAVTDIFSVRNKDGTFAGILGNETSISNGSGISKIVSSASPNSAGSRAVVVPLSTEREAERLAEQYVNAVASAESKLKLSNPDVDRLIYIPCRKDGNRITAPSSFGSLVPSRIGRTDLDNLVIL